MRGKKWDTTHTFNYSVQFYITYTLVPSSLIKRTSRGYLSTITTFYSYIKTGKYILCVIPSNKFETRHNTGITEIGEFHNTHNAQNYRNFP